VRSPKFDERQPWLESPQTQTTLSSAAAGALFAHRGAAHPEDAALSTAPSEAEATAAAAATAAERSVAATAAAAGASRQVNKTSRHFNKGVRKQAAPAVVAIRHNEVGLAGAVPAAASTCKLVCNPYGNSNCNAKPKPKLRPDLI
jgi:hypothetical protein